jgi:hypothetical protein
MDPLEEWGMREGWFAPARSAAAVRVVWVDPASPTSYPYVRAGMALSNRRRGRPRWSGPGRMVAYGELPPEQQRDPPGCPFVRPVWWLRESPRPDPYPGGPCEAVEPRLLFGYRAAGGELLDAAS